MTNEALRIIRSLVAGSQIVADTAVRVQEALGVMKTVRVTERGLEIVGPTVKVIRVNAGKMHVPFFVINNSWMFFVFYLKEARRHSMVLSLMRVCAASRAVLEVPLSDPVDEIFLLYVAEAFRVAR